MIYLFFLIYLASYNSYSQDIISHFFPSFSLEPSSCSSCCISMLQHMPPNENKIYQTLQFKFTVGSPDPE